MPLSMLARPSQQSGSLSSLVVWSKLSRKSTPNYVHQRIACGAHAVGESVQPQAAPDRGHDRPITARLPCLSAHYAVNLQQWAICRNASAGIGLCPSAARSVVCNDGV